MKNLTSPLSSKDGKSTEPAVADREKMLTVKEASEMAGIAITTLTMYCRNGKFPNARKESSWFGDYWVIPEADLTLIKRKERGRPPMKN